MLLLHSFFQLRFTNHRTNVVFKQIIMDFVSSNIKKFSLMEYFIDFKSYFYEGHIDSKQKVFTLSLLQSKPFHKMRHFNNVHSNSTTRNKCDVMEKILKKEKALDIKFFDKALPRTQFIRKYQSKSAKSYITIFQLCRDCA